MNKTPLKCKSFCYLATILFSIFVLFGSANAEYFTVTKTEDTNDGVCNADCSLREAVTAANNAPSDDVILFDPSFDTTVRQINLIGDSINIADNGTLNILGKGSNWLTVSGSYSYRVFYVRPSARATISGLTMRNGRGYGQNFLFSGGCLYNNTGASLSLFNVVITDCSVSTPDPGIALFGGGIYNLGTLNLNNTRVQNNRVPVSQSPAASSSGGGIYNGSNATLNLDYSSVINNTVDGSGGGIYNASQATLNLRTSTVSGNSATGTNGIAGALMNAGTVNVTSATVANNSAIVSYGGVSTSQSTGQFNSRNAIYADNKVGELSRDFHGPIISGGFNLIENATEAIVTGDPSGNTVNVDPMLRPLNSGGYHLLNQLSPVIDRGKSFGISNDQRLQSRPYDNPNRPNVQDGDGADMGAIELQYSEIPNDTSFDFDGDRKTDLSIYRPSTGTWWHSYSGSNTLGGRRFGISTDIPVSSDFTGDNKGDLAYFRPSNATWNYLRSEDFVLIGFQFGESNDIPAPGDFDGDNKADAAVYRPSTGQWFIRRSSDNVVATQHFGLAEDKPAVADYDGDGKADVAIYRPSTGAWWINRSSLGIVAIQFGSAEDKIVQGDYTGDNKADLALWRPSNGYWYILRSEDFSFYGFPFGTNGDLPVPGDYDGDGNLDAGIYRPSENVWYLLRSTQGISIQQFGTSGDIPIPNIFVR